MRKVFIIAAVLAAQLICAQMSSAQVAFMGKIWAPIAPEMAKDVPASDGIPVDYFSAPNNGQPAGVITFPNVRCFGSQDGATTETIACRTWELAPRGWYRIAGSEGKYTLMFTGPSHGLGPAVFIRPVIYTNNFVKDGVTVDRKVVPTFDYGIFAENGWDNKPAHAYYQPFTAKGNSITNVGFKVVHDGVDGMGPESQTILVSIHEVGAGTPDTWKQIGPTGTVLEVDSGGPKNYEWTVAWNSGQIPTVPGKKYAVRLQSEKANGKFQMYMRKEDSKDAGCYRKGGEGEPGWTKRDLWMGVSSDCDGLYVPYNKCIQKDYRDFAGSAKKWSQTYVAQGKSLAGVLMYSATSGIQPSMNMQRLMVRVREGGPKGKVIGAEKISIGNGQFTGDSSWGTFGAVYSPDEVKLTPGKTYAIEFETLENYESLHGYLNCKNMLSDDKAGFNPYKKVGNDTYALGTSYKEGTEKQKFDLDMQIVEYANDVPNWDKAVDAKNLVQNGDMEKTSIGWAEFSNDPNTAHKYAVEGPENKNHMLQVAGIEFSKVDGGYVQKISGLKKLDTYRLNGKVRSSFSLDWDHATSVGYDLTGQTTDPKASTIVWTTIPGMHSIWNAYSSDPIRPEKDSISIWLKAKGTSRDYVSFKSDFDDFSLQRVKTEVPGM